MKLNLLKSQNMVKRNTLADKIKYCQEPMNRSMQLSY